jgi:hypothetical protein
MREQAELSEQTARGETKGGTAMKTLLGFYDLIVGDDDRKGPSSRR